jgi:hypothetical protein
MTPAACCITSWSYPNRVVCTVAMRYRLTFTARAFGRSVQMGLVEIYTVPDGLIVELDVYYKDPSAVAALLAG